MLKKTFSLFLWFLFLSSFCLFAMLSACSETGQILQLHFTGFL